eukprot:7960105-Pyramimonas_sp.AAC.1
MQRQQSSPSSMPLPPSGCSAASDSQRPRRVSGKVRGALNQNLPRARQQLQKWNCSPNAGFIHLRAKTLRLTVTQGKRALGSFSVPGLQGHALRHPREGKIAVNTAHQPEHSMNSGGTIK